MKVTLCLIAKDENSYLKEWLDYHILLGVEHFWIYDNDSTVPLAESVEEYLEDGWVTVIPVHGKGMQLYAYDHCIRTYGQYSQWIGFIDTDEFIVPKTGKNIPEFLADYDDFGGLALSSLFFGSGGNQSRPACGQICGYHIRAPEDLSTNRLVKSIVQPARVIFPLSPHSFLFSEGNHCVNELGNRVDTQFFPCSVTKIQLNHYFTRSADEWKEKMARGRGDMGDPYSDFRWKNANEHSKIEDVTALELAASKLKLPPSISHNVTALTDPESTRFLEELSGTVSRISVPVCNARPVEPVEKRPDLEKYVQDLLDGMDLMGKQNFQEARYLYTRLWKQFPFDLTQLTNIASACTQMGDFPAAWEYISQAWRISPRNWTVLLCMVDYFYATENFEQAEKCSFLLQGYGNLEPIGVAVLALAQWKMNKQKEALDTARLLIPQLTPELASSHMWFKELHDLVVAQGLVPIEKK